MSGLERTVRGIMVTLIKAIQGQTLCKKVLFVFGCSRSRV